MSVAPEGMYMSMGWAIVLSPSFMVAPGAKTIDPPETESECGKIKEREGGGISRSHTVGSTQSGVNNLHRLGHQQCILVEGLTVGVLFLYNSVRDVDLFHEKQLETTKLSPLSISSPMVGRTYRGTSLNRSASPYQIRKDYSRSCAVYICIIRHECRWNHKRFCSLER